jgi:CBS domain containing-hemolysin-like protein
MPQPTVFHSADQKRKERRIARLRQQLQLLEAMDSSLWWKAILCSSAIFVASVIAVVGLLFFVQQMPEASTLVYATIALIAIIFTFRFWNPILWSIFTLSILIAFAFLFDDVFSPNDGDLFDSPKTGSGQVSASDMLDFSADEKSKHRLRVERAIEKRKRKIERLLKK